MAITLFKLEDKEDILLLKRLTSNDVLAFEEIYNRYSKSMFLYAMNILKKKHVCEDIIQNIFVDFWSKREKVKILNLKAYLFRSVKYQIFNHIRNQKISSEDLSKINIIDLSLNMSQKLEFDELEKFVNLQVLKLPKRCQQIFTLSRYEHKSHKEISSELGISNQAVKNQISKALGILRKNLASEETAFYFLVILYNL